MHLLLLDEMYAVTVGLWLISIPAIIIYVGVLKQLQSSSYTRRIIGFLISCLIMLFGFFVSAGPLTDGWKIILGLFSIGPFFIGIYRVFFIPRKKDIDI